MSGTGSAYDDPIQLSRSLQLTDLGYRATDPDRPNPLGPVQPVRCITCTHRAGTPVLLADCVCYDHVTRRRAS